MAVSCGGLIRKGTLMKHLSPEKLFKLFFCPPTQVTIEVVDGLESHEAEKGLRKERKPNWRNWWPHSSSFPARHNEEHDHNYAGNNEDSNFLRPSTDWDRRGGGKAQTEYGENDGWPPGLPALICAAAANLSPLRRAEFHCGAARA